MVLKIQILNKYIKIKKNHSTSIIQATIIFLVEVFTSLKNRNIQIVIVLLSKMGYSVGLIQCFYVKYRLDKVKNVQTIMQI